MHFRPSKYRSNATRFESDADAHAWGRVHVKDWPRWSVQKRGECDFVIALQPKGPWARMER